MNTLTPKSPSEEFAYAFDLTERLGDGDTVSSVAFSIEVYEGADPQVSTMLTGSPSVNGALVSHKIRGGVNGTTYYLEALATTTDGEKIAGSGLLLVKKGA